MTLPTFLIAGVQKAGSTSVWQYLGQHPQVFLPSIKEIEFLSENRPPELIQRRAEWFERWPHLYDFDAYQRLFDGVTDEVAIADGSMNALFHYDQSISRIQKYVPDIKIFVILRHPVERAFSDYLMHLRDAIGDNPPKPLVQQSESSFQLRKGLYYEPVKHYQEAFGPEQFKVFLYDDLCRDSTAFMQKVYTFIGVDTSFTPDTSRRNQVASVPKNQAVNQLLRKKNPVRDTVAKVLKTVLPTETRQAIRQKLIDLNSQPKNAVTLSPEERQKLVEYYREDVLKLQDYIGRDLSAWLK